MQRHHWNPIAKSVHCQSISQNKKPQIQYDQFGFTLIELMVVVVIIAILAAIAVPSYNQYIVKNAEDEAKAQMQQIQIELEKWRASSLSYKGFVPKKGVNDSTGNPEYGYVTNSSYDAQLGSGARLIYIPLGSDTNTHRYVIALIDGKSETSISSTEVLNATPSLTNVKPSTARSWKMMAIPNPDSVAKLGHKFMMTSAGIKCQSKDPSITIVSSDCGVDSEAW